MSTVAAGPDVTPPIVNELDTRVPIRPLLLVISGPQRALHKDFGIVMPLICFSIKSLYVCLMPIIYLLFFNVIIANQTFAFDFIRLKNIAQMACVKCSSKNYLLFCGNHKV